MPEDSDPAEDSQPTDGGDVDRDGTDSDLDDDTTASDDDADTPDGASSEADGDDDAESPADDDVSTDDEVDAGDEPAADSDADGDADGDADSDADSDGDDEGNDDDTGGGDEEAEPSHADELPGDESDVTVQEPEVEPAEGESGEDEADEGAPPGAEPAEEADTVGAEPGGTAEGVERAAEAGMDAVQSGMDALGGGEGPESDQEMPLTAHIEEMMRRLAVVLGIGAVVSLTVLFIGSALDTVTVPGTTLQLPVPSAEELIRYFWDYHIGLEQYKPHVYGPLEFILTKLKVAGLAGLLVGLPVFVYQTYRFMRPGLYPHERRYYLAAVPTSFVLGVVGATFAHVVVLPFVFDYFISYTKTTAVLAFGLKETFNLILILMGYFAVVFQIPLFVQLAITMNVVSREWMEERRLIFWGAFLGLAFTFIAVDPTGFAPIIVGVTMIALFEGTLALLRWTGN
ncbi:twin-arginine translocase subunit TatC [Halobaculum sp. P14]|uniref:twin-arginine translocase subunit TatC n=1 Tax=Halobaculum sp. P14 TaxID=3421638 RepID=UPI003EBE7D67